MKATTDLFDLIKSLTSSEKRYFKVYAGKHVIGEQNNYLLLFDAIDEQEEYDEDALKEKFKKEKFIKHLAAEKRYLQSLIMKSLRSFNEDKTIENQLMNMLADERMLKEKALYNPRKKLIKKAIELCQKYEEWNYLLQFLERKRTMEIERNPKEAAQVVEEMNAEVSATLSKLQNESAMGSLRDRIFMMLRSYTNTSSEAQLAEIDKLVNSPLLFDPNLALTFRAKLAQSRIWSSYFRMKGDVERDFEFDKKTVELYESHPHFMEAKPTSYKRTLTNYLNSCHRTQRYDLFPPILKRIKELPSLNLDDEGEVFQTVSNAELLYLMNTSQFEKAEALVPEIEVGCTKFAKKINESSLLTLWINVATLFLATGSFSRAFDWNRRIIDMKSSYRQDLYHLARVFELIIHFELGNFEILNDLLRSVSRDLKKSDQWYDYEKLVFARFKKLCSLPEDDRGDMLQKFRDELTTFKKEHQRGNHFGLAEIQLWIQSRQEKVTMAEILKQTVA